MKLNLLDPIGPKECKQAAMREKAKELVGQLFMTPQRTMAMERRALCREARDLIKTSVGINVTLCQAGSYLSVTDKRVTGIVSRDIKTGNENYSISESPQHKAVHLVFTRDNISLDQLAEHSGYIVNADFKPKLLGRTPGLKTYWSRQHEEEKIEKNKTFNLSGWQSYSLSVLAHKRIATLQGECGGGLIAALSGGLARDAGIENMQRVLDQGGFRFLGEQSKQSEPLWQYSVNKTRQTHGFMFESRGMKVELGLKYTFGEPVYSVTVHGLDSRKFEKGKISYDEILSVTGTKAQKIFESVAAHEEKVVVLANSGVVPAFIAKAHA